MSKLLAAVAVSSLFATPALANTAAPLSIAKVASVKASTSAKKSNKMTGTVVAVIAGAVVIGGVVAAASGSDSP
ncbi:hypothetical protein [Novosphingobium album (ex Hu et al. 2023)]|uniref:Uncharacterized protein n=1 Tax=Novosphingobium album (ex Hu et al. 2023) TaxID=2930093 RepID=A0ABT0B5X3_9SPHN|nr:hypothetical protein [Novosphingobium album (ex Hu et al. 2023)]MCJ2180446.1 hypothetical protein [Novosphingobium album (ex Hu et al. 2023)]